MFVYIMQQERKLTGWFQEQMWGWMPSANSDFRKRVNMRIGSGWDFRCSHFACSSKIRVFSMSFTTCKCLPISQWSKGRQRATGLLHTPNGVNLKIRPTLEWKKEPISSDSHSSHLMLSSRQLMLPFHHRVWGVSASIRFCDSLSKNLFLSLTP